MLVYIGRDGSIVWNWFCMMMEPRGTISDFLVLGFVKLRVFWSQFLPAGFFSEEVLWQ